MSTSLAEPNLTTEASNSSVKENDVHNNSNTISSASGSKPVGEFLENRIQELPEGPEAEPPIIPSAPTALTSIPPHLTPDVSPARPRSRPTSRDTSPYPRSRPPTPNRPSTPSTSAIARAVPTRRSARTLAKGPERPRGPPELEAALTIAIRNLESDIYEWWCANQKPGSPIPTTSYLKSRSPRIRRAAEAVDEADKLLNDAVYGKTRKGRPPGRKAQGKLDSPTPAGAGEIPDTAFGQMELNSQANSPLGSAETEANPTQPGGSTGKKGHSTRNRDTGD